MPTPPPEWKIAAAEALFRNFCYLERVWTCRVKENVGRNCPCTRGNEADFASKHGSLLATKSAERFCVMIGQKNENTKIYGADGICHINVVFSNFETIILQKDILSASSVDKNWLWFWWKLTSFVRVWRAYWPVPFAKRERGCHASYGDRKRGRRRPFSAVTPLSHSFSPSANRADLTRFFSYNHSSFILFLLFFSQYTSSSHSIECLPLHGRLREAQEQKKETSLRRLFLILMQAAHHVIKEEEMLLQQQLCRTLLTYKLNLIAMSTSRFSGCFQRPLRS